MGLFQEANMIKPELLKDLYQGTENILKIIVTARNNSIIQLLKMYIILVYDVGEKRVGKMLKLCRKYLNWIQNSVFEGEITEVKLHELQIKASDIMDMEVDSLIIFKSRNEKWLDKEVIGKERSTVDTFL